MSVKWTNEQLQAINEKGENILVAAAAGSGKTTVLVERIINKIINENVDIDKILIVTFTNAAASEMRAKILDAIYKKIEENPNNTHLQRQITLLVKSNISTIHAFCLEVIKNNFYEIDVSPNFKIADTTELEIMRQEVLEDLFEEKYENYDKDFLELINTYTTYKSDDTLKELILKIYKYIQSFPFPQKWLEESTNKFLLEENISFEKTAWGEVLFELAKEEINDAIIILKEQLEKIKYEEDFNKFLITISEDIRKLEIIYNSSTWDELYINLTNFKFDTWPRDKKAEETLREEIKQERDKIKKSISNIIEKIIICNSEEAIQEMKEVFPIAEKMKNIIIEFSEKFAIAKKEKNIIDFNDIEHFALKILIKEENGKNVISNVAKKYREKFVEIAIDEYQDSNLIQEYILTTISRGNNIFMVGDIKQSIYKFRQARPELFLEKYEKYKLKEELQENDNLKIQLFKNFRSRKEVLDFTNLVFENIMQKELGDIEYNENEFLNLGANYPENKEAIAELNVIDLKKQEDDDEEDITEEKIENIVLEAKFVAKKIKQLFKDNYMVCDKNGNFRKLKYKDIVILLRATANSAQIFEKEISNLGIPVFSDSSCEYIESIEIQTIMSLLKIIDNPINDISLVTVLRSMIGGFSDNELIQIRINDKTKSFYESALSYIENKDDEIKYKLKEFLEKLEKWRKEKENIPLDEFIWKLYIDTGFYNYVSLMPNGILRQANLKLLFEKAKQYETTSFKGLFNFISFIDKLKLSSTDMSSAKLIGENEDVVRIMSIHKSKGLEFPVVFLSCTGKKFNVMDLNNSDILLHQELGIGLKYIDYNRQVEYNTLAKEAIKNVSKIEMLSEEMRILYVALTRSKEKLIITGIANDLERSLKDKEKLINTYKNIDIDCKINKNIVKRYMSYLDWIELVYLNNLKTIKELLRYNIVSPKDIIQEGEEEKEKVNFEEKTANTNIEEQEKIKNILNWNYKYNLETNMITKTSVTQIKNINKEKKIDQEELINKFEIPEFLKENKNITGEEKGNVIHLILQKLNPKEEYNKEKINALIEKLLIKKIITKEEKEIIDINIILNFLASNIWKEMQEAKVVCQEQPFYININASKIYEEESDENILVQGIIDLYYINKNDEIILVDYKTDKKSEKELKECYNNQLEIYKEAIENSLNKNVSSIYIYSTYLNKTIAM